MRRGPLQADAPISRIGFGPQAARIAHALDSPLAGPDAWSVGRHPAPQVVIPLDYLPLRSHPPHSRSRKRRPLGAAAAGSATYWAGCRC